MSGIRHYILVATYLIVGISRVGAQYYFEISPDIEQAYQAIWTMDFDTAKKAMEIVKTQEPNNLLVYHIENYIDFVRILLTDDMSLIESYRSAVKRRLEKIKLGDSSSPYYYYCQAEIYLQRSLIRRKNHELVRAGWDINRAYKLLKKCKKEHPDFRYADKSLSVIHILMGSIKGLRKTFIKLMTSLDGSINEGVEEISSLSAWDQNHRSLWSDEIIIVQSLIQGHILKDWTTAYETVLGLSNQRNVTPLGGYLIGSTARQAGQNEEAIKWLTTQGEHSFYHIDYLTGVCLLARRNPKAEIYFKRYIDNHRGLDFIKSAHQRMAWYQLLINNDPDGYMKWMNKIKRIGDTQTSDDRGAQFAVASDQIPNKHLLMSRLMFDGGYYNQAWEEIQKFVPLKENADNKLEWIYRKARILHKLGRINEAVSYYGQTINEGGQSEHYYACNASLQMAIIFYNNTDFERSIKYIKMTLAIHPSSHRNDLHQEAKVLRERINKRVSK